MSSNPRHLRPTLTSTYDFLRYYAKDKQKKDEKVFCLQIGANDGNTGDPVHEYFVNRGWFGLLVEPQLDVFEKGLKKTYAGNSQVILENVALGNANGQLPFYRVAISKSTWATGLSSFNRGNIEKLIADGYVIRKAQAEGLKIPENPADLIETVQVPTMTVESLFLKYQIKNFQVLCIDTEGYDLEILKLIDLKKFTPEVIFFESKHLSDKDFIESKTMLTRFGYTLFWQKGDTLAIKYPYPLRKRISGWMKAFVQKL